MKSIIAFAALLAIAYGTPIELYKGPTMQPYPALSDAKCPSCVGKDPGNYVITGDATEADELRKYYLTCDAGGEASCRLCDPKGELYYNPNCDECRSYDDKDSDKCQKYTGPTSTPKMACSDEDNGYAIEFCQNLKRYPGLEAFEAKSGDFSFVIYDLDPTSGKYEEMITRDHFYISCVEGMYGWCRPCPDGLKWYPLLDDQNNPKKDCGRCDYPRVPTTAP